jgi:very-short-patch-repair endonuclease
MCMRNELFNVLNDFRRQAGRNAEHVHFTSVVARRLGFFIFIHTQRTEIQRGGYGVVAVPGNNQTASVGAIVRARVERRCPRRNSLTNTGLGDLIPCSEPFRSRTHRQDGKDRVEHALPWGCSALNRIESINSKVRMNKLRWCTTPVQVQYMRLRQEQNMAVAKHNPNESWMRSKLAATDLRWTRQPIWGYRLFDFWNYALGIAVEVDGPEHQPDYDAYRDEYNFRRSGIVVLRVRNRNEEDADMAIQFIKASCTLQERKKAIGIAGVTKAARRALIAKPYPPSLLQAYIEESTPKYGYSAGRLFQEALI